MKKRMLFTLLTVLLYSATFYAQEAITEENYLKQDSMLWQNFENQQMQLSKYLETMPHKKDSIKEVYNKLYENAIQKNMDLAIQYASVPSGLQRLYMVRLDMSKDTLEQILNSLNIDMQQSIYGKNIKAHIQTTQIKEGDSISTFPCTQDNGKQFDWTITNGKQLLILYGGLGCMGENRRQELKQLYQTTSQNDFLILIYQPCSSLQKLQEIKQQYPSNYIFISDFKQDASPMKIKYGTQATPTCFLTDKKHVVKVKCIGLQTELFNPHIRFIK